MIDIEYKKQLVYLPKTHALNLLRFAEAHSFPSLDVEDLPANDQITEPVRFACGQISNVVWECWENAKHEFKVKPKELEWKPGDRRKTNHHIFEERILRGKYRGKYCEEILSEAPSLEGHLSDTLELRFAFPTDVWEEMRSLHIAQERSFSAFLAQLLEMYTYRLTKQTKGKSASAEEE